MPNKINIINGMAIKKPISVPINATPFQLMLLCGCCDDIKYGY